MNVNNNNSENLTSFIHYLSLIIGNTHDFDLLSSFVALEIITEGTGIILDDTEFFQNKLYDLLDDLKINKEQLNTYFESHLKKLNNTDYIQCLYEYRNKILHGKVINSNHLALIINNFLIIVLINLLNINCLIYLPLLDEIMNSKEFIDEFKSNEVKPCKNNTEDNLVKLFEYNNELYLPLTVPQITSSLKTDDDYNIITFKTVGENKRCLQNIKLRRR